ncbi:MAG: hypothetical protein E5W88_25405 [Mesorhizobium sp.]|nr:MAG: hypothetical protein E5W88_25405 [Mesorhizobium sp.]
MEQNLKVQDSLVNELLAIEAKLVPLEARKEELKEALRGFGAKAYTVGGVGTVQVSEPAISKKTGTKLEVDQTQLPKLSKGTFDEVFEKGFAFYADVMSRAAKARVEIKLAA